MKIYLVGGAVRDKLLGLPIKERDWVVVGATSKDMKALGYQQVGKEFPVFLHPKTKEEYALARTENKVRPGYQGFEFNASPEVGLEEDLRRRDLTINAMAETEEGQLIDPYGGRNDLKNKCLRHVSAAFAEDPVRILRVGRFLSRLAPFNFSVAPETLNLMKKMVDNGEVNALVAERVWKEFDRSLGETDPVKFFWVLQACGAFSVLFPMLEKNGPGLKALELATEFTKENIIRFAVLLHALPEKENNSGSEEKKQAILDFCQRFCVPTAYKKLALLVGLHYQTLLHVDQLSKEEWLKLFGTLDIYRREDRFHQFLTAVQAILKSYHQDLDIERIKQGARLARACDIQGFIQSGLKGKDLMAAIEKERLSQIEKWLKN